LHEGLDRPLAGVARALGTNPSAAKQLVVRARRALAAARVHTDVDVPVDPAMVDRLIHAIETRSVDAFTALLADDVWGVTDGGGRVRASTKPLFGARAVARLWAAANRRQLLPVAGLARARCDRRDLPAHRLRGGRLARRRLHRRGDQRARAHRPPTARGAALGERAAGAAGARPRELRGPLAPPSRGRPLGVPQ